MTRILARYLSATILKHYALFTVLAVLVASLIGFLENQDGLMDDPSVTMLDALKFSALSAPGIFSLLAGFIALMSVLIAAISLLRYSELKAMLAAGLGYRQLLLALAPAALLMLGFHFLMDNVVLPRSAAELREWGIGKSWKRQPGETDAIWSRDGDYIVAVSGFHPRERTLAGVELFALGPSGDLKWQVSAPIARLEGGELTLPEGRQTIAGHARTVEVRGTRIASTLDYDVLRLLAPRPERMASWDIARVLRLAGNTSHPPHVYELWLQRKLAGPVTTALAVFLLAPLVGRLHRVGGLPLVLMGLAGGFCYFVADGILTGLGEAGMVRPAVAAWSMPLLLGLAIVLAPRGDPRPARDI